MDLGEALVEALGRGVAARWAEVRAAEIVAGRGCGGLGPGSTNLYYIWVHGPGYGMASPASVGQTLGDWPGVPAMTYGIGLSANSVKVGWQDNANNETGYKVFRWNLDFLQFELIATVGPNVTSYTDGARAPSSWYVYTVWAMGTSGDSYAPNYIYANTLPP